MKTIIASFLKDQSGATAIEYGLIVAVIGLGIVVGLSAVRDGMNGTFNDLSNAME